MPQKILNELQQLRDTNSDLKRQIEEQTLEINKIKLISKQQIDKTERNEANKNMCLYGILLLLIIPIVISLVVSMSQKEEDQYNRLESKLELAIDAMNTMIDRKLIESEHKLNSYWLELEAMKVNALSESKYYDEMDKILHGIQWQHPWLDSKEILQGPIFYLGLCKVRVFVSFLFSTDWNDHTANYYLKRYEGQYDDVINSCRITYRHYTYVDEDYGTNSIEWWSKSDTKLEVTKKFYIGSITKNKIAKLLKNNQLVYRVYFDTS